MGICIKCKGVLNFVVQGRSIKLQSDGDVTVIVSKQNRTAAYNGEFTLEERNPSIVANFVVPDDVYVRAVQELCNVPIVLELCDGRTFSSDHASNINQDGYDAKTNIQAIELICDEMTELLPVAGAMTGLGSVGIGARAI
jgi:hypothetical protein